MGASRVIEGLQAARGEVEQVCGLLLVPSPDTLARCPEILEQACRRIAEFRSWFPGVRGDPAILGEARHLQFAVRQAARLLASAQEYHGRWSQILGGMTGGYTPQGDPAPLVRRGEVYLSG